MNFKFDYLQNKIKELDNRVMKLKLKSALNTVSIITNSLFDPILIDKLTGYETKTKKLNVPSIIWYFCNLCYIIERNCFLILGEDEKNYFTINPSKYDLRKVQIQETYLEKYPDISMIYSQYNDMIFL